jgi:hypothetical protein
MNRASSRLLTAILLVLFASAPLSAQSTPAPAPAPAPSPFSGLIFGNYNYQVPTTPAQLPGQIDNAFVLDRAYLTFRMPAGDHLSIRITTDVYQTTENTPNAYTVRAKYAYLQYDVPRSSNGTAAFARLGILQNVFIEFEEAFWPRYLSQVAVERAGYFSSADVGVAAGLSLPNRLGEVYAEVVNGPGYTSRERDRFKDFAIRLSLTPFANNASTPLLQSFTLTGWGYKGALASQFVNAGAGQLAPVGQALDRSRAGVFIGLRDPRLVLGGEFDARHDGGDAGLNTAASPRIETGVTGHLLSGLAQVRPFAFTNGTGRSPFGLVGRYDKVSPTVSSTNLTPPPASDNSYHVLIGGLFYDVNQRAQFALDYQEVLASDTQVPLPAGQPSKTYYLHFTVNF